MNDLRVVSVRRSWWAEHPESGSLYHARQETGHQFRVEVVATSGRTYRGTVALGGGGLVSELEGTSVRWDPDRPIPRGFPVILNSATTDEALRRNGDEH
jgi:hypothetical protein